MKSGYKKSSISRIKIEIRQLAEDMLYTYKEVIENTSGMYDEEDMELPLYTTSERLLEAFEKDVSDILAFHSAKVDK